MSLLPLAAAEPSPYGTMGMFVIFFLIMYFLMIRPQRRKEKERKEMIATLKSGCRVMMSSGIIGQVTNVKEHTLIVRIAENTKVEVVRGAIVQLLEDGETPSDIGPRN